MNITVFGASGFVGKNVIQALKQEDLNITATDILRNKLDTNGIKFKKLAITNRVDVDDIVKDADIVIHLAASPLKKSLEYPTTDANINISGTLNILDACRNHNVNKIIFSSASSLIGDVQYNPVDEQHPCNPKTPYGISKLAVEHYLRVYQEVYGLEYLTFRFFNVYGPGQYPQSGALIPTVYQKLINDEVITLFGNGTRDYIYVGDVAKFYIDAVLQKHIKNEIVNMGTGIATTAKDLVKVSADILGRTPIFDQQPPRPGEIGDFVADVSKLRKMFGHVPRTGLYTGLKRTFDWLKING